VIFWARDATNAISAFVSLSCGRKDDFYLPVTRQRKSFLVAHLTF
jgi:hypothetical protein